MDDKQFIYAVARIRAKELTLLSRQNLEQLLSQKSYTESLRYLQDKGWGDSDKETTEQLLSGEREKTWGLIRELVDKEDMPIFDVFLYSNDFHNLKAAIKQAYTNKETPNIFIKNGTIDFNIIIEAAKSHDFSMLPSYMIPCAEEAYEVQFRTGDSQLTDTIIDKACLEAIYRRGKDSGNNLLKGYSELKCAAANINIALRASKTKKDISFLKRAFAACDTLDVKKLIESALSGEEAIYDYLEKTNYSDAVNAIKKSPSEFDRWCDNRLMEHIRPQKYNPFTISPIAAYVLAKENEIKSVRIILSGKLNELPEDTIKERLRDMYV